MTFIAPPRLTTHALAAVDGKLIASDDFTNLERWDGPGISQWKAEKGVLKQSDSSLGPASLFLKMPLKTGRITVKARRVGGNEGFLMFVHAAGPQRYMFCNYGAAGNQFSAIQGTPDDGIAISGGGDLPGAISDGRWYDISLVMTKNSAEMLLDGKRVSRVEANALEVPGTHFVVVGGSRHSEDDQRSE
jgi:hypothetical protein